MPSLTKIKVTNVPTAPVRFWPKRLSHTRYGYMLEVSASSDSSVEYTYVLGDYAGSQAQLRAMNGPASQVQ
jgi:hypothetical protein